MRKKQRWELETGVFCLQLLKKHDLRVNNKQILLTLALSYSDSNNYYERTVFIGI